MFGLKKPSPALVIALLALFISLSGTAVAAGIVPLAKRALTADKAKLATRAKLADTANNAKKVGGQTAAGIITQAAGTPGPASSAAGLVTVKQATDTIQPNTGREVVLACDAGKKVVSGGWSTTGDAFGFDSHPVGDTGWATWLGVGSSSPAAPVTLYVVCIA
jgi:ABC-type Fe3+-hydroxamate transport system substrate-binding protein